jgi:uncharacterized membrane protein
MTDAAIIVLAVVTVVISITQFHTSMLVSRLQKQLEQLRRQIDQ